MSRLLSGRYLGARLSREDSRDRVLVPKMVVSTPVPQTMDWRDKLPPAYNQGSLGSCTANACNALLAFYNPPIPTFSRLQTYFNTRTIERTVETDAGSQIRDALKCLQKYGAAPEFWWPYDTDRFREPPPVEAIVEGGYYRLGIYRRILNTTALLQALAFDGPVVFSFLVPDYFDDWDFAMRFDATLRAYPSDNQVLGAHAVLAVGYDLSTNMILVRNSWGPAWGMQGHFWMPIDYVMHSKFGNDVWAAAKGP